MRKKMILRLSVLAVFLALLWSCRSEDFTKAETNPQRNNADFFKHKSSLSAKNTTDYIRILEEYSQETDFLSGMPDQKGMPIWDKMKVVETKEATGLTIPLSYDNETMSSLLFVILDAKNTVNGIRNMTNDNLESLVYNPGYSIRSRESLMNTFIMMDHHTFGNEVFTNIPIDLFAGHKEGENNNRLIYKGDHGDFTHNVEHNAEGKILVIYNTTCTTSWHCKNDKPIGYCDGCSKCKTTACGTTITTIFIDGNSDFPTWDGSGSEGGGDGSSGGTTAPPKDPCGLASVFYRPAPGCGGGGTIPNINDPCENLKAQTSTSIFKNNIKTLENKTGDNFESGYRIGTNPDGTLQNQLLQNQPGTQLVDLKAFSNTITIMHSHYDGLYPIFSPGDIIFFNQWIVWAQNWNAIATNTPKIPLNDLTFTLVTSNGNYSFNFDGTSTTPFPNYTAQELIKLNKDYTDNLNKAITVGNVSGNVSYNMEKLEKEFLKFINDKMNMKGLKLYKTTENGNTQLNLVNGERKEVDCPQ